MNQLIREKISCQIVPNLFNNSTTIKYSIPKQSKVILEVFDVQGRNQSEIINSVNQPGNYQILWNGKNDNGMKLPAGVYFIALHVDNAQITKQVLLLK